jgi:hypothetical protein
MGLRKEGLGVEVYGEDADVIFDRENNCNGQIGRRGGTYVKGLRR